MFNLDGIKVSFRYEDTGKGRVTHCVIFHIPTKEILASDSSRCGKMDNFSKATGRKLAFTRALNNLYPGENAKETRKRFWEAYFSKTKRV